MAALKGNKNAEHWTLEDAKVLFNSALELTKLDDYDFIGEIARDLNTYRAIFDYLVDKFPELQEVHKRILSNLEANCFLHTKKETINVATGIVNLKSNYKWTDRQQVDTNVTLSDELPKIIKVIIEK
jgi:hypothetical protein